MFKQGYNLITDEDFENAIDLNLNVAIIRKGRQVNKGLIRSHNMNVVHVENCTYIKNLCEFMVSL
ncbi:MAG: hypothetical protein JWM44_1451 [Bacilli bacterium]|nr:hypothetical protein [Bacilli bacterium]